MNTSPPPNKKLRILLTFLLGVLSGVLISLASNLAYDSLTQFWEGKEEIISLIEQEALLAANPQKDAARYLDLFTDDALIANVRGREFFDGAQQIADRYLDLEQLEDLEHRLTRMPEVSDDFASSSTTGSFTIQDASGRPEVHFGYEFWTFQRVHGQWRIKTLLYNLENDSG